jgi:hypothetical protein
LKLKLVIYCRAKLGLLEAALIASIEGRYANLWPDEPLFSFELADPQCLDKFATAIAAFGVEYACPREAPKKRETGGSPDHSPRVNRATEESPARAGQPSPSHYLRRIP